MSLALLEVDRTEHPVDVIEQIAAFNNWAFERAGDDEISLSVGGDWTDYHVSFTWLPDVEALHLGCAFDLKTPDRRRAEILNLVALVNEQLWIGHFGLWESEGVIIFRHSLLLTGGMEPNRQQCESLLHAAVTSCERFYQAFQFVLWAGRNAREALDAVLFETAGEA
jgi:hypothetical protein